MLIQHNYLAKHRKQLHLTQSDIAFCLNLADYSSICRFEQGVRNPNLETLIIYHLLFDISIESLFDRQKQELQQGARTRIILLIEKLKSEPTSTSTARRLETLQSILTRLTSLCAKEV